MRRRCITAVAAPVLSWIGSSRPGGVGGGPRGCSNAAGAVTLADRWASRRYSSLFVEHRSFVMVPSVIGLFVGLALGFAAVFGGLSAFAVVAVFAAIGFVVGKVIEGEIDVSSYLSTRGRTRR
jgi:hypothetical protein